MPGVSKVVYVRACGDRGNRTATQVRILQPPKHPNPKPYILNPKPLNPNSKTPGVKSLTPKP